MSSQAVQFLSRLVQDDDALAFLFPSLRSRHTRRRALPHAMSNTIPLPLVTHRLPPHPSFHQLVMLYLEDITTRHRCSHFSSTYFPAGIFADADRKRAASSPVARLEMQSARSAYIQDTRALRLASGYRVLMGALSGACGTCGSSTRAPFADDSSGSGDQYRFNALSLHAT